MLAMKLPSDAKLSPAVSPCSHKKYRMSAFDLAAVALFLLCGLGGGGSLLDGMAKRAPGRASTQNKTLYSVYTVNAHMIKH